MRYMIAHGDVVHFAQVTKKQSFDSGQPNKEEFEDFDSWITRLQELGVDTTDIEKEVKFVAEEISRFQFHLGLKLWQWNNQPLKPQIDSEIAHLPEPRKTIAETKLSDAVIYKRSDKTFTQLASAVGMESEDIDDFFNFCAREEWEND